jgi:phage terminase large subunit
MRELRLRRWVRRYQQPLFDYMIGTPKARAIEIAHRRWGKDEIALGATAQLALDRPANYWHCLPEYEQGRKAIWTAVNAHTGKRRIDEAFPPEMRAGKDEQSMLLKFVNGSTWQVVGSDRYNATVGAGVGGIVYSEWALANPSAWAYHRPMVEENNGWALFITTPRGRNHAHAMYQMAQKNKRWFAEVSSVKDTHARTSEQLHEDLLEYQTIYGKDAGQAYFEQEYYCNFNAAILGAFYGREMADVRLERRITPDLEPVWSEPVHTAWDIGVHDDTSIIWFQVVGMQIYILDSFSAPGGDIEVLAEHCFNQPWKRGIDYVPHDAAVKAWGTTKSRLETMRAHGLNPELAPDLGKLDGINAVRVTLPRCVFHARCEDPEAESGFGTLIPALEQYRRKWDDERKIFSTNEERDWTTHLADAFRYLAVSWKAAPRAKVSSIIQGKPGQVPLPPPPDHGNGRNRRITV